MPGKCCPASLLQPDAHAPEVVIRVVSPGSNMLPAIRLHLQEIGKGKHRALEDDYGEPICGKTVAGRLIEDWDLDLEDLHWRLPYVAPSRRTPPKLVHKILFSMPRGTSPEKLLLAVRQFARREFAEHRYALSLHTDDPHPHVHLVLKARSEGGVKLNIRKPMLREWRLKFAACLRDHGVPAKATPHSVQRRGRPPLRGPVRPSGSRRRCRQPIPLTPLPEVAPGTP